MDKPNQATAVFGEALIDDFITEQVVGGAPLNVACNLAALGAQALLITRVGNDLGGAQVREQLGRLGVPQGGVQADPLLPTGRAVVERSGGSHRFILLPHQAYDMIDSAQAHAALAACDPGIVYFGTLAQRGETSRATLQALLRATGATRFLDLNVREGHVSERRVYESLHAADIVKVNEDELLQLLAWYTPAPPDRVDMDSEAMRASCAALLRVFALQALVVTLGPGGAAYVGADGAFVSAPGVALQGRLADTVGAGDAFSSVFLLGRMHGWPLDTALNRANRFAAAVCTIRGAVAPDPAFYASWRAAWCAPATT